MDSGLATLRVAPRNDWAKLVNRFAHMISFTESLY
jgi:hypothetical protein